VSLAVDTSRLHYFDADSGARLERADRPVLVEAT
jgi:hypothetical protein